MPALPAADLVIQQAERLCASVQAWSAARWATAPLPLPGPTPTAATRGDVVHHLVGRLADLGALAERRAPRAVPRLDSDLGLPDQLRVVVHDLVAAGSDDALLVAALDELLLHRAEVDGARPAVEAMRAVAGDRPDRRGYLRAAATRCLTRGGLGG